MEAWDTYWAIGAVSRRPDFLISLAIALARAGQMTEGLKQIDQAIRHMEATDERISEAALHRIRGKLLLAASDPVGAEISFRRAIAVARQQNAKVMELHATINLARLWRGQSKRTDAHNPPGQFTAGSPKASTLVLQDAMALLDRLA